MDSWNKGCSSWIIILSMIYHVIPLGGKPHVHVKLQGGFPPLSY